MRTLWIAMAMACTVRCAAADVPFAPIANLPDYVLTIDAGYTLFHHAGRFRADRIEGPKSTEYFPADGATHISVRGDAFDFASRIELVRHAKPPDDSVAGLTRGSSNTGERQTHLGESCTVWNVRREDSGRLPTLLSCVTDDGIELWRKIIKPDGSQFSVQATRLERRPVAPEEVRPPHSLLALNWWESADLAQTRPEAPDHELVMSGRGNTKRTIRRHRAWVSVEETIQDARRIVRVTHDSRRMWLSYSADATGATERMTIFTAVAPPSPPMLPQDLGRTETILGETCQWLDLAPDMTDTSRSACVTKDGIRLKEQTTARDIVLSSWTAVRLTRGPVGVDAVKPPVALFEPSLWGLE